MQNITPKIFAWYQKPIIFLTTIFNWIVFFYALHLYAKKYSNSVLDVHTRFTPAV